jgi:DNA-binding NarL/FixJ family response regulator
MMDSVRVILVDDHEIVRLGLKTLLEDIPWIQVVAEGGSAEEALHVTALHQPDVVVMDIRMPGDSGIEACKEIVNRWPKIKIVMLTSFDQDDLIFQALQAGASGFVLKQVGNQQLIDSLDAVRKGTALLDPAVTLRLIEHVRRQETEQQAAAFKDLSHREMMVLSKVAKGMTNKQIADALNLSEKTVRNHVSAILAKLNLTNRIEAATYAVRNNIEHHLPEQLPSTPDNS